MNDLEVITYEIKQLREQEKALSDWRTKKENSLLFLLLGDVFSELKHEHNFEYELDSKGTFKIVGDYAFANVKADMGRRSAKIRRGKPDSYEFINVMIEVNPERFSYTYVYSLADIGRSYTEIKDIIKKFICEACLDDYEITEVKHEI